jgi:hypothetical protein
MSAPVAVTNTTADTIPPGAAMEPVGTADANGRLRVRKPTADDSLAVLINSGTPIPAGQAGTGHLPWFGPLAAAVDASLVDTATGGWAGAGPAVLGVKSGSWHLHAGQTGFVVQAEPLGGLVPVQANPGGGGTPPCQTIIDVRAVVDAYGVPCETRDPAPTVGCGTVWYCTPTGLEEVAVGDPAPAGFTGGPYRSAQVADDCGCSKEFVCGGFTYTFPSTVTITLSDVTGCIPANSRDPEVTTDNNSICSRSMGDFGTAAFMLPFCSGGPNFNSRLKWTVTIGAQFTTGPVFTGNVNQTVGFSWPSGPIDPSYTGSFEFTGSNGFSNVAAATGPGTISFSTSRTVTGTDGTITTPLLVGTLTYRATGGGTILGTAKVYIL